MAENLKAEVKLSGPVLQVSSGTAPQYSELAGHIVKASGDGKFHVLQWDQSTGDPYWQLVEDPSK